MSLSTIQTDNSPMYRLIESHPHIAVVLLDNTACFDEAVKVLRSKIEASLILSSKERKLGLMMLPQDSPDMEPETLLELAGLRIMVRVSEGDDLYATAEKNVQSIMGYHVAIKNYFETSSFC